MVLPTYSCTLDLRQLPLERLHQLDQSAFINEQTPNLHCFIKAKRKGKIFEFLDREILVDVIGERTLFTRENHSLPTTYLLSVEADPSQLMEILLRSNFHLN